MTKKWCLTTTVNDPIFQTQESTLERNCSTLSEALSFAKDILTQGWDVVSISITLNKKED